MTELQWRKLVSEVWYIFRVTFFILLILGSAVAFVTDELFRETLMHLLPLFIGPPLIIALVGLLMWLGDNEERIKELEKSEDNSSV